MKILIVDDSKTMRNIIMKAVTSLGYEPLEAGNGEEALAILSREYADIKLICSDWNMPKMNGYELLKILHKNIKYKNIPVMMITTEAKKEKIIEAVQAGAKSFIRKPFTAAEFAKKVDELFKVKE